MSCFNCSRSVRNQPDSPELSPYFKRMYKDELASAKKKGTIFAKSKTRWLNQKTKRYDKYLATRANKNPVVSIDSIEDYYYILERHQEINENYRDNYAKYLNEHPEPEMSYEEWVDAEIAKTYEYDMKERKRRYDDNGQFASTEDVPLTLKEYIDYTKNYMKFKYFGGKTIRPKHRKLQRTRRT